jgi:hypothetical protein
MKDYSPDTDRDSERRSDTSTSQKKSSERSPALRLQRSVGNQAIKEHHEGEKPTGEAGRGSPDRVESGGESVQRSGEPLPTETRTFFESRFGHDFGDVRIHTAPQVQRTAASLNARAYTRGNDIGFAGGEYDPGSSVGKRLLAHELTHTIQQTGGDATGPLPGGRNVTVDDTAEREAERAADRAVQGLDIGAIDTRSISGVQRQGRGRNRRRRRRFRRMWGGVSPVRVQRGIRMTFESLTTSGRSSGGGGKPRRARRKKRRRDPEDRPEPETPAERLRQQRRERLRKENRDAEGEGSGSGGGGGSGSGGGGARSRYTGRGWEVETREPGRGGNGPPGGPGKPGNPSEAVASLLGMYTDLAGQTDTLSVIFSSFSAAKSSIRQLTYELGPQMPTDIYVVYSRVGGGDLRVAWTSDSEVANTFASTLNEGEIEVGEALAQLDEGETQSGVADATASESGDESATIELPEGVNRKVFYARRSDTLSEFARIVKGFDRQQQRMFPTRRKPKIRKQLRVRGFGEDRIESIMSTYSLDEVEDAVGCTIPKEGFATRQHILDILRRGAESQ